MQYTKKKLLQLNNYHVMTNNAVFHEKVPPETIHYHSKHSPSKNKLPLKRTLRGTNEQAREIYSDFGHDKHFVYAVPEF